MGQKSFKDTSPQDPSTSVIDDIFHDSSGFARDVLKVTNLSWDQFVQLMQNINEKSGKLRETNEKYLIFAVKKGTTDTFLWKATVSICCIKMNALTHKVESKKYLNLRQFLKVYESLLDLIEQQQNASLVQADFNASTIISKIDELNSSQINFQESVDECIICMERPKEVVLPCAHGFCLPCIDQWNEQTQLCPTCRTHLHSVDDAWVISDVPEKEEISRYLLQLADSE